MDALSLLKSLGFEWPSPAYLVGALLFGVIGLLAFRAGRRSGRKATRWLGLVLMLYPYAVSATWALYAVGLACCAGLVVDRQRNPR